LLLLDRLKFADYPSHSGADITGDRLEVNRPLRDQCHHDRAPNKNADARTPLATMRSPAVDSAPKYLTSDRNAAEMSAAFTRAYPRVWVRAATVLPAPLRSALAEFRLKEIQGSVKAKNPAKKIIPAEK
jgi:hypothetical protein